MPIKTCHYTGPDPQVLDWTAKKQWIGLLKIPQIGTEPDQHIGSAHVKYERGSDSFYYQDYIAGEV